MSDQTYKKIAEIRARWNAARPAPWSWLSVYGPSEDDGLMNSLGLEGSNQDPILIARPLSFDVGAREVDMEAIAHAPEDIKYLLDLVKAEQARWATHHHTPIEVLDFSKEGKE